MEAAILEIKERHQKKSELKKLLFFFVFFGKVMKCQSCDNNIFGELLNVKALHIM